MKESYGEDLASHSDPESCTVVRKRGGEVLTGACQGGLLSREIILVRGADVVSVSGRAAHR
jgi:RNA-directed DNA polymerase